MLQRSFALLFILLLAACGNNASSAPEATSESSVALTAEVTAVSDYDFPLTQTHETPLNWGGTATFGYPVDWRVRDTSQGGARGEITIYGVDSYNVSISVSNDTANNENTVETLLNRMNQNAVIETTEREGRTIYYTITRGGNAFAAALYVDENTYAFAEMVNTRRGDLSLMQEMVYKILLSVETQPEA